MLKDMNLATKMFLSFGFVTLISVLLGLLGYYGAVKSDGAIEEVGLVRLPSVQSLLVIKENANGEKSALRTLLISGLDKGLRQRQYDNINTGREAHEAAWKIYESLPQSSEESVLWQQLVAEWKKWQESNGVFLELARKIDTLDVGNPGELRGNLEKFRGDHYEVATNTLNLLKDGKAFKGGDNEQACNFGKWLETFKTSNPQMKQLLQDVLETHGKFHDGVLQIKNLVAAGKTDEASGFYINQMVPSMKSTFGEFDKMLAQAAIAQNLHKEAEHQLLVVAREHQTKANDLFDKIISLNGEISTATVNTAKHNAKSLKTASLLAAGIGVVLALFCAFTVTRGITGPVAKTMALAEAMARGDFTARLDINQKDEIGAMGKSLNSMAEQVGLMIKEIVGGVNTLSTSSTEMAAVSKQLSANAGETSDKSAMVASAAEEMSTNILSVSAAMEQSTNNVQLVATATEEMSATVNEIGQNAEKARSITEGAVKQSQLTSEKMSALGESAKKVGRVTETITEISEQTNLLALNATIEAARAGEAGKGFAVVASEIKELAKLTAAATIDIKRQIEDMQDTTTTTIGDIARISEIIDEINNIINGIATAVEEQATATNEISTNIAQAAQGITEVNENVAQSTIAVSDITRDIADINTQSSQVGAGSNQVEINAQGLSALATQLAGLVAKFKV